MINDTFYEIYPDFDEKRIEEEERKYFSEIFRFAGSEF